MPYLRGPLRVVVKTQASPDIRFKKYGNRVLIFPLSRALRTEIKEFLYKVYNTHPVSTIQCHRDYIVVVSTDFIKSGDYIFFDDGQFLASCIGLDNGQKDL